MIIALKKRRRGDLIHIEANQVSQELTDGWKSPPIPAIQRQLTDEELARMYEGKVIIPFRVLADCIHFIKGETKDIIEIGCSTGYYYEVLSHLLGQPIRYTGVDYSPVMISEATKNIPMQHFV